MIDADFPGGYQVEVIDVNGDHKPDIVGLGNGTCAWFENPTWKKRVVTGPDRTPGIISTATADLDGDGKSEIAIAFEFAMNRPNKGKLALAIQGAKPDDPWTLRPIADVGSIHRLRWSGFAGRKRPTVLVVAPIFGPEAASPGYTDPARLSIFETGDDPKSGQWTRRVVAERPVIHAIEVFPLVNVKDSSTLNDNALFPLLKDAGTSGILTADNLGVAWFRMPPPIANDDLPHPNLVRGATGEPPQRGASEIHRGKLADGRLFLATVEPWHGRQAVIYPSRGPREFAADPPGFGPRNVIDDSLDDGHALWVADVDGDGDDEVFAGHRGKDHRVSAFDFDGKAWNRTILDREIAAQDLRGGDLDGDGRPDIVAIGGQTHNIIWYRPAGSAPRD